MSQERYDKFDKILAKHSKVKLKVIDTNEIIDGEIISPKISPDHPFPEATCDIATNDVLKEKLNSIEKYSSTRAILTTSDGVERSCIICNYQDDNGTPFNVVSLRSIDLNK